MSDKTDTQTVRAMMFDIDMVRQLRDERDKARAKLLDAMAVIAAFEKYAIGCDETTEALTTFRSRYPERSEEKG